MNRDNIIESPSIEEYGQPVSGVEIERYLTIIEAVARRIIVNEVKWKSEKKNNVSETFDSL
ncbi:MAG: hypothetical protein ACYS32_16600 [Planctomycetota bacterium]|jgi:hypothetical protein